MTQQASGALRNALLDARARALGIPVHELLGGALRDTVGLYWAHCGTYRVSHAELMHRPPLRTLDDLVAQGREVAERGYSALKTNLLLFDGSAARRFANRVPGGAGAAQVLRAATAQLDALRRGAGPQVALMLDVGSNFGLDGAVAVARAIEPSGPMWLELQMATPEALRLVRDRGGVPIASGENLRGAEYHALLRAGAVDVVIIDVLFNGLIEGLHIAAACAAYNTPVAVHNCYSPLATLMNAAFCAAVPNLRIMERDVDQVPWAADLLTVEPETHGGFVSVPATRAGERRSSKKWSERTRTREGRCGHTGLVHRKGHVNNGCRRTPEHTGPGRGEERDRARSTWQDSRPARIPRSVPVVPCRARATRGRAAHRRITRAQRYRHGYRAHHENGWGESSCTRTARRMRCGWCCRARWRSSARTTRRWRG